MTFEDLLDILAEQFSCDAAELSEDTSFEDLGVDAEDLVELAWQLALNGEVTVREEGDAQLYSLDLDQAGMERVAYAIAPDVRSQALTLTGGDVTLTVKNGELTAISLSCTGTVQVVVAQVQARLEADIAFTQREADFPQSVIDALRQ